MLDQKVERLRADDIPGERHDLTTAVERFRHFLRFAAVCLRQNGYLGPDLIGRDLELLRPGDALQDQVGLDGADRVVAGVLAEPGLVPSLGLQHLLQREPGALGAFPRVRDPVLGLLVDEGIRQVDRRRCRSWPAARDRGSTPSASRSFISTQPLAEVVAELRRACRTPRRSSRTRRRPRAASLPFTSFTSTWMRDLGAAAARRTARASASVELQDVAGLLAVELLVQLRAELAGAHVVEVVGAAWPPGPPRRARCCARRRRRSRSARRAARPARARRTARGDDRPTRRPPRRSPRSRASRPSCPCSRRRRAPGAAAPRRWP